MDPYLLLAAIVFAAAALQAATGVGFGVIGGPVLLAILNDSAAVQISILLNLLIALLMLPFVWKECDRELLWPLLAGLIVGSPLGLLLFLQMNLVTLKILACVFVLFAMYGLVARNRRVVRNAAGSAGSGEKALVGVLAGVMGSSLAMPGPVPASWMAMKGYSKVTIRATILVTFVVAYLVALLLQGFSDGVSELSISYSMQLALPTVAGVLVGHVANKHISENWFRKILLAVLAATVVSLLVTLSGT